MFAVAIDGPAGSGKSTIAKKIAQKFNFIYIDTGAMYRAVALYYIGKKTDTKDQFSIIPALQNIEIQIKNKNNDSEQTTNNEQSIYLNNEDVTDKIRTREVAEGSSNVAVIKEVREKLVHIQKQLSLTSDVVMDGRDIGSYVLPAAQVKIYLTASIDERAKRRHKELKQKGMNIDIESIRNDISERDYKDMNRQHSPLTKAKDAIEIDTTNLTIEETLLQISRIIKAKLGAQKNDIYHRKADF